MELATASSLRIDASRADADAQELRNFDSSTFEANPEAPRGPTYTPQCKQPGAAEGRTLDARAKAAFLDGEKDGSTADKYIRLTVILASILFLVGISTQFPYRGVPYGLVGLGIAPLVLSFVELSALPRPPS